MKIKYIVALLIIFGLFAAKALADHQNNDTLKDSASSTVSNPSRVAPDMTHYKSIYKDQTISYHYECYNRVVDVSAVFKVPNQNFRLRAFRIKDTVTNDETDLTSVFSQHIENIYGMRSLKFVCHSSKRYIYAIISNANPWNSLESLDRKRGKTYTINEKNEVEEGLRTERKGN